MASSGQWDSEKMLDLYIHDYLVKKNMNEVAEIFAKEANIGNNPNPVAINTQRGFLTEWWTIFCDVNASRPSENPRTMPTQMVGNEQQHLSPPVQKQDMNQQWTREFPVSMAGGLFAGSSLLASKLCEAANSRAPASHLNPNQQLLDVDKMAISNPSSGDASHSQRQFPPKAPKQSARDMNRGVSLGRTSPEDSALFGITKARVPRTGLHVAGFSFEEIRSLNSSKDKILCCHFSSDGNILASAGHDKKVLLWNMNTLDVVDIAGHSHLITDVRFRPNSSVFATSSFDRTIQIWDANKPSKMPIKLLGHAGRVTSLDFNPRKVDLLCSCDNNDEIRLWNVNQSVCTHVFKGATRKVRFQPQYGDLMAAASGNVINLFDVETHSLKHYLQGHVKEVRSMCWDITGRYIVSVSEDSARVWSVVLGGKCIHELPSNGKMFESCTFHPRYSHLLVIGSYRILDFWNPTGKKKKPTTVTAHNDIIAALAESSENELIASASHDRCVKVWK